VIREGKDIVIMTSILLAFMQEKTRASVLAAIFDSSPNYSSPGIPGEAGGCHAGEK